MPSRSLSKQQRQEILQAVEARFAKNTNRHKGLAWAEIKAKLEADAEKLSSLNKMERTGGEPDVVGYDRKTGEFAQRKARKAAEVFATTTKRWSQEKKINQRAARLIWHLPWALSF